MELTAWCWFASRCLTGSVLERARHVRNMPTQDRGVRWVSSVRHEKKARTLLQWVMAEREFQDGHQQQSSHCTQTQCALAFHCHLESDGRGSRVGVGSQVPEHPGREECGSDLGAQLCLLRQAVVTGGQSQGVGSLSSLRGLLP